MITINQDLLNTLKIGLNHFMNLVIKTMENLMFVMTEVRRIGRWLDLNKVQKERVKMINLKINIHWDRMKIILDVEKFILQIFYQ